MGNLYNIIFFFFFFFCHFVSILTQVEVVQGLIEHLLVELVRDLQELEVVEIGGKVERVLLPTAVRPAH